MNFISTGFHKHHWSFSQDLHCDNKDMLTSTGLYWNISLLLITVKRYIVECILYGCQDAKTC